MKSGFFIQTVYQTQLLTRTLAFLELRRTITSHEGVIYSQLRTQNRAVKRYNLRTQKLKDHFFDEI